MEVPYKTKHRATIRSCNPIPGHISRENSNSKRYMNPTEREKQIPYANTYIWNPEKKNGSEESTDRTGIKTQVQRMDLGTQGGGRRVSWDEVREWHGHIYTAKCKIDS